MQHLPRLSFALGPLPEAPLYLVTRNIIVINSLHRGTFVPLPSDFKANYAMGVSELIGDLCSEIQDWISGGGTAFGFLSRSYFQTKGLE